MSANTKDERIRSRTFAQRMLERPELGSVFGLMIIIATFMAMTAYAGTFNAMFGIEAEDLNDFAIDCCRQQTEDVYGDRSLEMLKFDRAVGI